MPPSRKKHNSSSGGAAANTGPENANDNVGGAVGGGGGPKHNNNQCGNGNNGTSRPMSCCVPSNCLEPDKPIYEDDIKSGDVDVVKIVCNNSHCNQDEYMHLQCFESWEKTVLAYLRSSGRSRPWSGKQKLQNIWTKKAYDVVFKACGCKCGSGHVRKDLNWTPTMKTAPIAIPGAAEEGGAPVGGKKKKKNKKKEELPTLAISAPIPHPNNNHATQKHSLSSSLKEKETNSSKECAPLSSSTGCSGSAGSADKMMTATASHAPSLGSLGYGSCDSFDLGSLPSTSSAMSVRPRINSLSSNVSTSSSSSSAGGSSPPPLGVQFAAMSISNNPVPTYGIVNGGQQQLQQQQVGFQLQQRRRSSNSFSEPGVIGERRMDYSNNGLFSTREDLRSLHFLPPHKFNRYHIKVMDDHGHDRSFDATRNFIVSTLKKSRIPCVRCIICELSVPVYDKYPLIDGTYFLSPRQHSDFSIEVIRGKQYMNAVCVRCLEECSFHLESKCCGKRWDSSNIGLVLGTCYTYDIFAATPCCQDRLRCLRCNNVVKSPKELPFFSDYSQPCQCPHCGLIEHHFVRPVPSIFNRLPLYEFR